MQANGHSSSNVAGIAKMSASKETSEVAEVINAATGFVTGVGAVTGVLGASNRVSMELPSGTREMWSLFDRNTRTCHYCTSTVTKTCSSVSKKGFLGIGAKEELNCEESAPVESCQDIQM